MTINIQLLKVIVVTTVITVTTIIVKYKILLLYSSKVNFFTKSPSRRTNRPTN